MNDDRSVLGVVEWVALHRRSSPLLPGPARVVQDGSSASVCGRLIEVSSRVSRCSQLMMPGGKKKRGSF